ncbi:MAG: hypothetical protein BGN84_14020 [Afipia sp. 62-7]|nr:MAG: hypothetical protein BGN84_14020 [Afipia sp. 62-7]
MTMEIETQPVSKTDATIAVRFDILSPLRNTELIPGGFVGEKLGRNGPQIRTRRGNIWARSPVI